MLILAMSESSGPDDDVIIRDRKTGRIICEIHLCDVRGTKARLGYTAPADTLINRRVLDEKIYGKSS